MTLICCYCARRQSIFHLTFHPSYPHLLASCSEDKTVRLWDATVPWGTNEAVHRVEAQTRRGKTVEKQQQQLGYRPRVEGELLAVLAERGHEHAVFSCVRSQNFATPVTAVIWHPWQVALTWL